MQDGGHPVLISPCRRFPYFNVEKISGKYNQWRPPVKYQQTTVEQFIEIIKEMEIEKNDSHAYFQVNIVLTMMVMMMIINTLLLSSSIIIIIIIVIITMTMIVAMIITMTVTMAITMEMIMAMTLPIINSISIKI